MKWYSIFLAFIVIAACKSGKPPSVENEKCFTGKLMIKGICSQRVVSVQDDAGRLAINPAWVHPDTGDTLRNVFSVENVCDFPATLDSGAVFKFRVIEAKKSDCAVCQAYTPIPDEKNTIEVCQE